MLGCDCVKGLVRPHQIPLDFLFEKVPPDVCGETRIDGIHHLGFLFGLKEPLPIVVVDSKYGLGAKRLDVLTLVV
jgi:hypothetical protein